MNKHKECCSEDCESGLRNNYFEGKRLTAVSFQAEQNYLLERRRLLNRGIHGWGVVYGYAIKEDVPARADRRPGLFIDVGLALDAWGRELLHTGSHIGVNDLILLDESGDVIDHEAAFSAKENPHGQPNEEYCWRLSVHYAERPIGRVKIKDPCECESDAWDQICETVGFSLQRVSCDECCPEDKCEIDCKCGTGVCCEEHNGGDGRDLRGEAANGHKRGGCTCLCEYVTNRNPDGDCRKWYEPEGPCTKSRVDLGNGVPLACVKVVRDDAGCWRLREVDACGPRRLVKNNDMLFDLIRGCDLTHITGIGWERWDRSEGPVPFDDFKTAFRELRARDGQGAGEGYGQGAGDGYGQGSGDEYGQETGPGERVEDQHGDGQNGEAIREIFSVSFSRPVKRETLRPECFAMTVMWCESFDGWWQTVRAPIVGVEPLPLPDDPQEHASGARFVFDQGWVDDGVFGRNCIFLKNDVRVEIEVRGDLIVDCNGQTVDANRRGLLAVPTGNGTPGGTFLSTIRVEASNVSDYEQKNRQ